MEYKTVSRFSGVEWRGVGGVVYAKWCVFVVGKEPPPEKEDHGNKC